MAVAPDRRWCRLVAPAAFERSAVIGFNAGEGRIEHFPTWNEDDIEASGHLLAPEHLARQAFGAVALDRRPELSRRGNPEPRHLAAIRQHNERHESAPRPGSFAVDALEIGPAPDPFGRGQRLAAHAGLPV